MPTPKTTPPAAEKEREREGYFLLSTQFLADLMKLPFGSEITSIYPDGSRNGRLEVVRVYVKHPTMPEVYGSDPDMVHCICEKIACHFVAIESHIEEGQVSEKTEVTIHQKALAHKEEGE